MTLKEQLEEIIKILSPKPCIIVTQRYEYDKHGNRIPYGLTVLAQSQEKLGHSHGIHTKYDYGFLQLDTESGIAVLVI